MTREQHEQAARLFREALAMDPGEREAWLQAACGEDQELLQEVRSLLSYDEDKPTVEVAAELLGRESQDLIQGGGPLPEAIGDYRIIRLIGAGGMGVVYEAEQVSPARRVALKVLRAGLASPALQQRFEYEAQVLGWLEHPGIARIYEAGTGEGTLGPQPFFAMEYVRGKSLTDYAQEGGLGIPERLELLARVADAIQHAHQKGVIHRDLKPGNLLVEQGGQPKVLDFGIARSTNADLGTEGLQTRTGELLGTLPYMSPEQLSGDPALIDVRSDIYSLGVVAYQLLCGRLPVEVQGLSTAAAVLAISQAEPRALGDLDRALTGDLQTVIHKALQKDPAQRYASMDEFAADLRRLLADEPILARAPTALYQLKKFAQRNRLLVGGLATLLVVLVAGIFGTTRFAFRERDARADATEFARQAEDGRLAAEQHATRADSVNEFLNAELLAAADPTGISDPDLTVREVLRRAYEKLSAGRFREEPLVRASVLESIGRSYLSLSGFEEAQASLDEAVELYRAELGEDHETTLVARLAQTEALHHRERYAEALPLYVELRAALGERLGANAAPTLECTMGLAQVQDALGEYGEAQQLLEEVLAVHGRDAAQLDAQGLGALTNLGLVLVHLGEYEEAREVYGEVVQASERLHGPEHLLTARARASEAGALYKLGHYDDAIELYLPALERMRHVIGEVHEDYLTHAGNLGLCYSRQNRFAEAEPIARQVYAGTRELFGEQAKATLNAALNLSALYVNTGQFKRAIPLLEQGLEGQIEVLGEAHDETLLTMNGLGVAFSRSGDSEAAEEMFRDVLYLRRTHFGDDHQSTVGAISALAYFLTQRQRLQEAEALHAEAVERALRTMPEHMFTGVFLSRQSINLMQGRNFEEATEVGIQAHGILEAALGAGHRRTTDVARLLADTFNAMGQADEAQLWREAAAIKPEAGSAGE